MNHVAGILDAGIVRDTLDAGHGVVLPYRYRTRHGAVPFPYRYRLLPGTANYCESGPKRRV
ncbi:MULTISPECIES: hypothetical protein [unclassified Microcoleus]|uniref:hypothetical protein n=1 Tax=unclassified Microcoleus TaxID=2642155 RepID=UPI002FD43036